MPVDRPALVCGTVHAAYADAGRAVADWTVLPVLWSDATDLHVHGVWNETGSVHAGYARSACTRLGAAPLVAPVVKAPQAASEGDVRSMIKSLVREGVTSMGKEVGHELGQSMGAWMN